MRLCWIALASLGFVSLAQAQDKPADAAPVEGDSTVAEQSPPSSGVELMKFLKTVNKNKPTEIGLELGEPTGLTFAYKLGEAGRATGRIGVLHRLAPFSFSSDTPVFGAGYQHDVKDMTDYTGVRSSGHNSQLTVGLGCLFWPRYYSLRWRPRFAVELPVGLRFRSPGSSLVMAAHLTPQLDVSPHVTLAFVAGLSVGWSFDRSAPPPAAEPEEPEPEPEPVAKPKPKKKAKKVRKRRRRTKARKTGSKK